jgi:hypothetical protein
MRPWPNSDKRLDTCQAQLGFSWVKDWFDNSSGMPFLLNLAVRHITGVAPIPAGNGYNFMDVWLGKANSVLGTDLNFVESYDPGYFQGYALEPSPSDEAAWWGLRVLLARRDASQLVGSYISGSRCQDSPPTVIYPGGLVSCCDVYPTGCHQSLVNATPEKPGPGQAAGQWILNTSDPKIGDFQDLVVKEILRRNPDHVFVDNMAMIGYMDDPAVATQAYFDPVMNHLAGLMSKMNGAGYGAILNTGYPYAIARTAGAPSPSPWERFLTALGANGIYAEDPFLFPAIGIRPVNAALAELEFHTTRNLLARGNLVVYSAPVSMGGYTQPRAAQWIAAISMVLREPGQPLFVSTQQDLSAADNPWRTWPVDFGPPKPTPTFHTDTTDNWHASRGFQKGDITVVHAEVHWPKGQTPPQPAPVPLPIPTGLSVTIQPMHGVCDPVARTYAATKDFNVPYDGFILSAQVPKYLIPPPPGWPAWLPWPFKVGTHTTLAAVRVYRAGI